MSLKKPQISAANDATQPQSEIVIPPRVLRFLLEYKPPKQPNKREDQTSKTKVAKSGHTD